MGILAWGRHFHHPIRLPKCMKFQAVLSPNKNQIRYDSYLLMGFLSVSRPQFFAYPTMNKITSIVQYHMMTVLSPVIMDMNPAPIAIVTTAAP